MEEVFREEYDMDLWFVGLRVNALCPESEDISCENRCQ